MPRAPIAPRRALVALIVALALSAPAVASSQSISATVDRTRLAVGEATILSVQVIGAQGAAAPQVAMADWEVRYAGPSTEVRFENGVTTSSVTHRYQLLAQKAGSFTFGPYTVEVDGKTLSSQPIAIEVVPRGSEPVQSGRPQLVLDARVGDTEPWVGERVPLTIRLLIPSGTRVDNLQFPQVHGEHVVAGAMPQPAQRDEHINGMAFRVLYFETHLTPLVAGERAVTVSMDLSVLEQARRNRQRGLFGMLGGFSQRRPVELRSEPLLLRARALPAEGRPPGFSGAVGSFNMQVAASPTELAAGDPVTVRVVVRGAGDLSKLQPPRYQASDELRAYDPLPLADLGGDAKGIEQVVIPQQPGVVELPALQLSFFDPEAEAYRTIRRRPRPLQVAESATAQAAVVAGGEQGRAEKVQGPLGRDIVFIKRAPGSWSEVGRSWWGSWALWLVHLAPALAVAGLWWRSRRAGALAANPKLRRFREAEAKARAALAGLDASDGGFVDRLHDAIGEYLGAKLDLPPGAIEGERVASALAEAGCAHDVCEQARAFFADLEALRYAPGGADDAVRRGLLARAETIVAALAKRRDLESGLAAAAKLALVAVISLTAVGPSHADVVSEAAPEAAFFAGNEAYAGGDYGRAVERYREALALGVESGALHFNLGNAHFKRGEMALAVASYLRARRLLPRDPDVAANLSFAEESLELPAEADPLWRRAVFALAYRASAVELATLLSVAWWSLCAVCAAMLLLPGRRDALRWPLAISALLALIAFANFAYRGQSLELWRDAVVAAANDVVVRFEPAADGTEHFTAPVGSRLTVHERREGWALVSRRDGRRGWLREDQIVRLR